jgi:hypothetical protein
MPQYKTMRLSKRVFTELKECQKDGETIIGTISRLTEQYEELVIEELLGYTVMIYNKDEGYIIHIKDYKRVIPKHGHLGYIIRIPVELYDKLENIKDHPGEIANTTILKIIVLDTAYRERKENGYF